MSNKNMGAGDAYGLLFSGSGCVFVVAIGVVWLLLLMLVGALNSALGWLALPVLTVATVVGLMKLLVNDVNNVGKK
jgi:hypothetical protein